MLRIAWCLLLRRCGGRVSVVARTPVVAPWATIAIAAIETVPPVEAAAAALVTFAIPVHLAHHRRGAFLVFVDAHRQRAQHIFGKTLLPLDLGQRGGRGIELEQREVRLAVLADAERERFDTPVFRIADEL